ncbi:MAG: serine/threonine protein kinase, partial [Polyangiaceae bacterium]|nr:serine/threonine protein kinase [Polyangiaceae bacterium]
MSVLVPGFHITPNIRLSRKLGAGGMGSIWVADHLSLETEVAVKFVSTDLSQNEDAKERFSREASASAKIKSPHVVQVFDHGETNGIPFIVMELLVGEDLSVKLEREGAMTIADLLPILRQVGKGLAMAHEAGVVHRDIKPANIFLTKPDGELFVKLLDFGIAKSGTRAHPSVTNAGDTLGTPYYMSPEQLFTPEDVDFRSDLWALAVVVYEALSGDLPYDGETIGVINVAIASGNYKPLTLRCPGMPASADEWFRRAFHKDRNKRFLSAKELVDAFAVSFPADSRASTSKTNSKDYFPLAS